jgi:coenzyme F420-reducing hydrogenase gamma subunit
MKHLGIEPQKLSVAVFDFTGCEGCELQLANREETLAAFLGALEVARFREISSATSNAYDVALIDGAITRHDEVERIKAIRKRAKLLVCIGSCSCFGGVNQLKNAFDIDRSNREVYGDLPKETLFARPVKEIVPVDVEIPGCPVSKAEVERAIQHLVWEVPYTPPVHSVCLECKRRFTTCTFEKGELCLGPITRGGCNAPCPAGGLGCMGCRGPAVEPNYREFFSLSKGRGFTEKQLKDYLGFFGGFGEVEIE